MAIKRRIKAADKVSAWLEATQIAGFSEPEANRFFGRPDAAVLQGLSLDLTPPADARARFLARHAELLAQL